MANYRRLVHATPDGATHDNWGSTHTMAEVMGEMSKQVAPLPHHGKPGKGHVEGAEGMQDSGRKHPEVVNDKPVSDIDAETVK